MGYLNNATVVVDAVLTKKGRELLSRQDNSFQITQFALGDDEIDYSLYNENHPNGSNYYGEAIENMPLLEAIPNENNIMVSKLITLPRNTTQMPVLQVNTTNITISRGGSVNISPTTVNFEDELVYSFTVADRRIFSSATTTGGSTPSPTVITPYTGTAVSQTYVGQTFNGTALNSTTLFGNSLALNTTIIVVGLTTGARTTISLTVNKNVGQTGTVAVTQTRALG